jgi:type I restriction enzyme S subunit
MRSNYRRIGDYIQLVDERNQGHQVKQLLGLSISKQFIPSVANIIGTDMENYKIIRKNQFACSTMQVRRDKKMPVALLKEVDEAIISQAYPIFQVFDEKKLLPDYLMMWFTRSEFDREACFHAVGGVRGSLEWDDFTDLKLPVPSIDKQREIVKEYYVIQDRIKLNEELIRKLEETAQAIYRQWFVEFEFPDEEGKPYKINGGEMVWNEELGKEIPKGWEVDKLETISMIKAGGDRPEQFSFSKTNDLQVPVYSNSSENDGLYGFTDRAVVYKESITISARGAIIGFTVIRTSPFVPIIRLIVVTPELSFNLNYLYETIRNFVYDGSGSAQGQLTIPDISKYRILVPQNSILQNYQKISEKITKKIEISKRENIKLTELKELLLSKLATMEC